MLFAWPAAATAAESACGGSVTHSTGKMGHKLTWLPYRPAKVAPELTRHEPVTQQRLTPYVSPMAGRPVQWIAADPFDDPFGDTNGTPELAPPTAAPAGSAPSQAPDSGSRSQRAAEPLSVRSVLRETGPTAYSTPETPSPDTMAEAEEVCGLVELKPISQITCDISVRGRTPDECEAAETKRPDRETIGWAPITFTWKASGLCHNPAYFEDVHLERYGHSWGPYVQPIMSGAHFFLTVPILPYKMGLYPPGECIYTLGYYRPGSCAPYMLDPLPVSVRAGLAEAGVWTGMVFLVP